MRLSEKEKFINRKWLKLHAPDDELHTFQKGFDAGAEFECERSQKLIETLAKVLLDARISDLQLKIVQDAIVEYREECE